MNRTPLTVTPLVGALGAEIGGVDLSQPLPDDAVAAIRGALLEHLVVFFRAQTLSPAALVAFGQRFGALGRYPFVQGLPEQPDVIEVKKLEHERTNFGGVWHSDTTYLAQPPMGSILYALEVPPRGGDTMFANMYMAYERLSPRLRELLCGLRGVSSSAKADVTRTREDRIASSPGQDAGKVFEAIHPAVRTHPETGRKALFVNTAHSVRFDGMTEQESAPLLDFLFRHEVGPGVHVPLPLGGGIGGVLGQPLHAAQPDQRLPRLPAADAAHHDRRRHARVDARTARHAMTGEGLDALARFAAGSDVRQLPPPVIDKAKACLLYAIAVGLACMRADQPAKAVRAMGDAGGGNATRTAGDAGPGAATRFFDESACDAASAAFANGTLFHARVQDDAHPAGHVGVVVVPAALAMAQATRATGADLVAALVAGYEVALRIGRDHTMDLSARGFRTTPAYGVFGAAAAAARLSHLDGARTAHALALAANMAAGLREYAEAGSEDYAYQAGFGAQSGIVAARLAAAGATAAASALDGKAGFFRAYGEPGRQYERRLAADLGASFELMAVTCKPYPICQFHRGVVRGALALREQARGVALEALAIRMHPFEADFFGVRFAGPFGTFPQTFMSAPFCAALAWSRGEVTLAGLTDFDAPEVTALVPRITVIADDERERYSPRLAARLADGTVLDWSEQDRARSYDLTWPVACSMAASLGAEAGVAARETDALVAAVSDIEHAAALDALFGALRLAFRAARHAASA